MSIVLFDTYKFHLYDSYKSSDGLTPTLYREEKTMTTWIRQLALVVLLGVALLATSGMGAQAGAAPPTRALMSLPGPSAATGMAPDPADPRWLDTDVPKTKDKPKADKPADKPKADKPADRPKADKPVDKPRADKPADTPKHCHSTRYVCGHHDESSNGFTISVPDWCTKTVCD
jgi:type IV secretory pathway VirB10-like protein